MTTSRSPYAELAAVGPYEVRIGTALITLIEPHPGHERAYNRWYEDDHFYAGAMAMPWMFTGRRWVAPRDLQALRQPADSSIARPLEAGKYISTYWINEGHHDDHMQWSIVINQRLQEDGRKFPERDHVFTTFQRYLGASYRDEDGPRDIHAFDHPYGGLVVEVFDVPSASDFDGLVRWLREERAPAALQGPGPAMCLYFSMLRQVEAEEGAFVGTRLTALWLTDGDPRLSWQRVFAGAGGAVEEAGVGRLELSAPFVPTLPGTDTYVDQLR